MLELRMMPPEPLMDQARRAMREERIEDAQAILINVIALEPENEEAWLLLAEAITDASKKRQCLERARTINPRNRAITRALETLDALAPGETPPALASPVVPVDDPPAPLAPADDAPDTPAPLPSRVAEIIAMPIHLSPPPRLPAVGGPVEPLLEAGASIVERLIQSTDPLDTRELGCELLRVLDEAAMCDLIETRRWARAAGRDALLRFEQVLTAVIATLPRDNPRLAQLREQRHRALSYLR